VFARGCLLFGSFGTCLVLAGHVRAAPVEAGARAEPNLPPATQAPAAGVAPEPGVPSESSSRGVTALVTGIATAGASLAYGGFLLTSGHSLPAKHDGLYVMSLGLTLAPLVAHGVAGEWARGALFSVVPALGGIGMAMLLAKRPDAPIKGKQKSQKIYPVLITISVVGSAVGIFDAALVDERLPQVSVAAGDGFVGADVSGRF
jgi:hypothetical protein